MTSIPDREEIIAELHKAGVRPYSAVVKLMIVIDRYALTVARRQAALARDDLPCDQYYWLAPGQWDTRSEVTRCDVCKKVKNWSPYFHLNTAHPSRHCTTCKSCLRKQDDQGRDPGGRWLCPRCRKRKLAGAFPEEKKENPRRSVPCISCGTEEAPASR